ncbi:MAG TPA: hypothetical protein VKB76_04030, partial [Ktedonobacterales bacterium]|nr:hypothetical protein [Ktedonobacterales bacterium]
TDPRYQQLRADTNVVLNAHVTRSPWAVPREFPTRNYQANNYAVLGEFSRDVVLHHPVTFVAHSIYDASEIWIAQPTAYSAFPTPSLITTVYLDFSALILNSYILLPIFLLVVALLIQRDPESRQDVTLMIMLVALTVNILFLSTNDFYEFYRLRSTLDWSMILVTGVLLGRLLPSQSRQQATSSPTTPAESNGKQNGATGEDDQLPTLPRINAARS